MTEKSGFDISRRTTDCESRGNLRGESCVVLGNVRRFLSALPSKHEHKTPQNICRRAVILLGAEMKLSLRV